jgi:hypothetical protein
VSEGLALKAGDFTFWLGGCGLDRVAAARLSFQLMHWVDWGRMPSEIEIDRYLEAFSVNSSGTTIKTTA